MHDIPRTTGGVHIYDISTRLLQGRTTYQLENNGEVAKNFVHKIQNPLNLCLLNKEFSMFHMCCCSMQIGHSMMMQEMLSIMIQGTGL
jgi:hypothetical protein